MRSHVRQLARALVPAAAAALLVVGGGGLTTPAHAADDTCQGVLSGNGDGGTLTKSVVSIEPGATAGTYTITYQVVSSRPAGVYRLRDCLFIDTGTAGAYDGETIAADYDNKTQSFAPNTGGGSTATFTQTVSGVGTNDQVCDRAAMSGTDLTGMSFTDKSNLLCVSPNNPPVIPESHLAVTLPLAAVGAVGLVLFLQRRRASRSPVA